MRKYTDKEEEDLIREIESDPELDKGWEPVEGHVAEIIYNRSAKSQAFTNRNR